MFLQKNGPIIISAVIHTKKLTLVNVKEFLQMDSFFFTVPNSAVLARKVRAKPTRLSWSMCSK